MGLLDDLGIKIGRSPEEKKDMEIKRMIEDSEKRRNALLTPLQSEADELTGVNGECYVKIGEFIFNNKDRFADMLDAELKDKMTLIEENLVKIESLKGKAKEIRDRYDEEIEILRSQVTQSAPKANVEANPQSDYVSENGEELKSFCIECGAEINDDSKFCANCGTKL